MSRLFCVARVLSVVVYVSLWVWMSEYRYECRVVAGSLLYMLCLGIVAVERVYMRVIVCVNGWSQACKMSFRNTRNGIICWKSPDRYMRVCMHEIFINYKKWWDMQTVIHLWSIECVLCVMCVSSSWAGTDHGLCGFVVASRVWTSEGFWNGPNGLNVNGTRCVLLSN